MTTVNCTTTRRFQYQGYVAGGELFCQNASAPPDITRVVLYGVNGYNASANDRYFQLSTSTSAGHTPLVSFPVPAGQWFSWVPSAPGFVIADRLARWNISSTGPTYTAAADNFWVNAIGRAVLDPAI